METFIASPVISFTARRVCVFGAPRCAARRRNAVVKASTDHDTGSPQAFQVAKIEQLSPVESISLPVASNQVNHHDEEEETESKSEGDADWYDVLVPLGKKDTEGFKHHGKKKVEGLSLASSDGALDLALLDGVGRELLTEASYDTVVDVDIEQGGVLDTKDEDNNDLFCGVGLDALIESEQIIQNLQEGLNIQTATHVQLTGIPRVLDGQDIVIQSHTGTGKTLAFLLPMLDEIDPESTKVHGVIVAPTRELAIQIFRECERLCDGTGIRSQALIGGANPSRQVEKLRKKQPHVVVGTPGRVAEMQENRELHMHGLQMLVIDEVDQCMQPAFMEDVVYLLRAAPRRVQKVLVSATSDVDSVRAFAGKHLHRPVLLRVGGGGRLPKNISHWYCVVPARMRIELLRKLMNTSPAPTRAIVFVDDPRRVDMVVERLHQMGVPAGALRGNAHKLERAEVLTAFRKGRVTLLVTTEVAARGLDVPEISHVFNLDLPTDGDHYVHRAGRCGRIGNVGTVVTITTADTAFVIGRLSKELEVDIRRMEPRSGVYSESIPQRRADRRQEDREAVRRTSSGAKAGQAQDGSRAFRGSEASAKAGKGRNNSRTIRDTEMVWKEGYSRNNSRIFRGTETVPNVGPGRGKSKTRHGSEMVGNAGKGGGKQTRHISETVWKAGKARENDRTNGSIASAAYERQEQGSQDEGVNTRALQDDEGFETADVLSREDIDEKTALTLLTKLGGDISGFRDTQVQVERKGKPSLKTKRKIKTKKGKAKAAKKEGKDGEEGDGKARVKKRWRDSKNKGKPVRREGRAGSVEGNVSGESLPVRQENSSSSRSRRSSSGGIRRSNSDTSTNIGSSKAGTGEGATHPARVGKARKVHDPTEKARRGGWVGNR